MSNHNSVNYDSSIDTKDHIKKVGEYVERLINSLKEYNNVMQCPLEVGYNGINLTLVQLCIQYAQIRCASKDINDFDHEVSVKFGDIDIFYIMHNTYKEFEDNKIAYDIESTTIYIINELENRKKEHDKSKLDSPIKEALDIWTPRLAGSTYLSDEYKFFLKELNSALAIHYKLSPHHPEHFKNGIKGMTLIDVCEMLADWKAATLRHNNGNIFESIVRNKERFNFSLELRDIFLNTALKLFN